MSFLTFNINKNHILFPLLFLSYFLRQLCKEIINNINKDKVVIFGNSQIAKRTIIDIYLFIPSNLLIIFLYITEKIRAKKHNSNIIENGKNLKDIELIYNKRSFVEFSKVLKLVVLTSTFNFIPRIITFFLFFFVDDDSKFGKSPVMSSVSIFYILATSLLSRIFLNNYFYRHHFVSLAINIFGLIINAIIDIRNLNKKYNVILYIIDMAGTISFSFASITGKFLLTYVTPYALQLYIGLVQIVYLGILFIPLYFVERNGENIFANFFDVVDGYKIIILDIGVLVFICCYGVFIWIIINKFSPNDYALSMMVENMIDKLFEYALTPETFTDNIFISIIQLLVFILLIIGICIHNEIIVINKWGLNEYTKKNISKKGDIDFLEADDIRAESFDASINDDNDFKGEEMKNKN